MLPNATDIDSVDVQSRITDATLLAVLLVTSASFVAMSLGDPELMALVALSGVAVVGLALIALSVDAPRLPGLGADPA